MTVLSKEYEGSDGRDELPSRPKRDGPLSLKDVAGVRLVRRLETGSNTPGKRGGVSSSVRGANSRELAGVAAAVVAPAEARLDAGVRWRRGVRVLGRVLGVVGDWMMRAAAWSWA